MKKKYIFITTLSALSLIGSFLPILSLQRHYQPASAYSTETVTTTIDLNDNSDSDIRSYYSSLNSLSNNQRTGNNLLINLKNILSNGQKYYAYDIGTGTDNAIWKIYEISDRDWEKSPASAITNGTYNSSTNTITNYEYVASESTSDSRNPYVHALYVNRDSDNPMRAWGNHSQNEGGINREHIWPKSYGFDTDGEGGARGDLMHLWAADGYVNGTPHNNRMYGFVDTSKSYNDAQNVKNYTKYSIAGNLWGTSKTLGSGTVFEPQDCDKGDIARACFYMAARYNNLAGATSGIDTNNPDLRLANIVSGSTGTSSATKSFSLGILSDLLEWNRLDPPDEFEIHRNNLLYNNYTNNRNPFIDFPEWADIAWGNSGNVATPTSDNINGWNDDSGDIAVTGISVSPSSVSLTVGENSQLEVTVSPNNATNKEVTYVSNNNDVASVNNSGLIAANGVGTATITVTSVDGGFTATCVVTVSGTGDVKYALVTGDDPIKDGDEIIIVAQNNRSATTGYALKNTVLNNYYLTPNTISISNQQITYDSSLMTSWKVIDTESGFAFYDGTNYLHGYKNGTYNDLGLIDDISSSGTAWNLGENINATGYDIITEGYLYLEFYYPSDGYARFTTYSLSNNYYPLNIYKKVFTAQEYAQIFISSISCDATGNSTPTLNISWNELSSLYDDIFPLSQKDLLINATYTVSGDIVTPTGSTTNDVAIAMSRYDIIIGKYSYTDYIGRKNTAAYGYSSYSLNDIFHRDNHLFIIILSISIFSISSYGAYLLIKKRKENR